MAKDDKHAQREKTSWRPTVCAVLLHVLEHLREFVKVQPPLPFRVKLHQTIARATWQANMCGEHVIGRNRTCDQTKQNMSADLVEQR